MFPAWWKRALFHGGIFQAHYLRFAVYYLSQLFLVKHPLGLLIPVLFFALIVLLIYGAGKYRMRFYLVVPAPSRPTLIFFSLILATCCASLIFVQAEYMTPEEYDNYTKHLRDQLNSPMENLGNPEATINAPVTGFFFYLDKDRVGNAYSSLQQAMMIASETTKRAKGGSIGLGGDMWGWKVDASGKLVQEQSTVRVPTTLTPERQVLYLMAFFSRPEMQNAVIHLSETNSLDSFRLLYYKATLEAAGIQLTPAEQKRFDETDFDRYSARFKSANQVVCYSGKADFRKAGTNLTLYFEARSPVRVTATGPISEPFLEPDVTRMLTTKNACRLSCTALVIEWKAEVKTNSVEIRTVPLAIW